MATLILFFDNEPMVRKRDDGREREHLANLCQWVNFGNAC